MDWLNTICQSMSQTEFIIQVFILSKNNEVLACRCGSDKPKANQISAIGYSFEEVISKIKKRWNINCKQENLVEVFSFNLIDEFRKFPTKGYILRLNSKHSEKLIKDFPECEFIYYEDLFGELVFHKIDNNLKESVLYLIHYLQKNTISSNHFLSNISDILHSYS